jgi:hypothetical protein
MSDDPAVNLKAGLEAAAKRRWPEALAAFGKSALSGGGPMAISWLGYCVARERGQLAKGISLCRASLREEPRNPLHHLLLGRILLLGGDKPGAIDSFLRGMECGGSAELRADLAALGYRMPPVIRWLKRRNPINRVLGRLRSRLVER